MSSYVTLQPMERWHLYSNYVNGQDTAGFLEYVRMFSIIGLLVLIIACINFINLTTARSEKRAREVGVRKAIGSQRKDLIITIFNQKHSCLQSLHLFLHCCLHGCHYLHLIHLTETHISIPFIKYLFLVDNDWLSYY